MSELISSSAEAIEGNDCLLTDILVRLPHKDIVTFKCVSKRWLSLISAPYFRRCHATVKRRVSGLLLCQIRNMISYGLKFFSFDSSSSSSCCPEIPDLHDWQISESCNGLMLVKKWKHMFICNPTTGEKKTLPWPVPYESRLAHYSLAFDPLRFLGYKLICVFRGESSKKDCYQITIYSSESGAWNLCGYSFSDPYGMSFDHGVYFKDSVYWMGWRTKKTLRFDLKEECVKDDMPPFPPNPHRHEHHVLAPACGYMNLVGFGESKLCASVFRLKEGYSSRWVLMHSVGLRFEPLVTPRNGRIRRAYSIINLIEDGEDEMALLLQLHLEGKIIAYRFKDNTCYDVFDLSKIGTIDVPHTFPPPVMRWHKAFYYIESLASV